MPASSLSFLNDIDAHSLTLFKVSRGQKTAVKSKKEKRALKRSLLQEKLQANGGIRNDTKDEEVEGVAGSVESLQRTTFTPGWMQSFTVKEALPIKRQDGKVVRSMREGNANEGEEEENDDDGDEDEDGDNGVAADGDARSRHDNKVKTNNTVKTKASKQTATAVPVVDPSIYEYAPGPETDLEIGGEQFVAAARKEENQWKTDDNAVSSSSSGPAKEKGKKATLVARFLKSISTHNAKMIIGTICNTITADPERSLRKHRADESNNAEEAEYKMSDLLSILQHPNLQILELAMLSCVLVFKDIIPGYRIRALSAAEKDAQVKKETKRLRDYENAILGAYQQFLNILHKMVADGLRNPKKVLPEWDSAAKLGLSALRCQCELLRAAPHFNCRAALLTSIVTRAAQPDEEISRVCCGALEVLFKHDTEGEASFEAVRLIGKVLAACKYDVPVGVISVLSSVKVRVHADEAKKVRRKAKSDRRKKRKDGDDVEAALIEADANPERSHALRFQADSLQELCLIYFRIIKMKVGFQLLPVALEGLGKISHLINIDTVADLVTLMATVLQTTSTLSMPIVQLHCIHCALRTLSGPGQELQMDEEIFVTALRTLMKELPARFDRWDVVLDCLDFALSKRRESRSSVVVGFVKLLFLHASHVLSDALGLALLSMANGLLLKYPRVRCELLAIAMATASAAAGAAVGAAPDTRAMKLLQEDDEVCDLAMRALRGAEAAQQEDEGDGSWLLALLKNHADKRYTRTILALSAKEVATVPLRLSEAREAEDGRIMARIDAVFNAIPSTISTGGKTSNKASSKPVVASSEPKKLTKMQEKNARRKARKNLDIPEGSAKSGGSTDAPMSSMDSFLSAVNQRIRQAKRPRSATGRTSMPESSSSAGKRRKTSATR